MFQGCGAFLREDPAPADVGVPDEQGRVVGPQGPAPDQHGVGRGAEVVHLREILRTPEGGQAPVDGRDLAVERSGHVHRHTGPRPRRDFDRLAHPWTPSNSRIATAADAWMSKL